MLASIDPSTGKTLQTFSAHDEAQVNVVLERAFHQSRRWRNSTIGDRASLLRSVARVLTDSRTQFSRTMTQEMGKTLVAAEQEIEKCASTCQYYADNIEHFLAEKPVADDGRVILQPLGVVLAIMPWNFPFWQVIRFAAPALAAGNVGVLKHASNVPRCALALEDLFQRAGAPDGVFQTLLIESTAVEAVILDDRIAAVTLTGSEAAGRAVAAAAGRALKKSVLELGGSDPFLVMPSAKLDVAIETAVKARIINNGQSCIAAKRFIVHDQIADEFAKGFADRMRAVVVGDPMDRRTELGPLATARLRDDLHSQVERSVKAGARAATGGGPIDRPGFFYQPTVLTEVPVDSPAAQEEVFGPVAPLLRARDVEDAVRIANSTTFGLGAAAWTQDPDEARYFETALEAGSVFINSMVASDPRYPFGGIKRSGYGRELSEYGLREFVNVKTIRRASLPLTETE
jgi:succinate-semialdehyde dehydrogenase / glutarate-semialdehyde dehydrogenase